jgi:predicted transposase/invertase (TIGR01784 family)
MKTDSRILELTSDVVFKAFMMSEKTKEYKAKLIHLITGIDEDKLLEAEYVCKEFPVNNKKNKIYKSDIVVNVENNILNIEMNKIYYKGLFEKNNTYMNKIRSESFNRGEDYLEIEKVIQINIDNFTHYKGDKIIYKFEMREESTGELECENIESYHIDLEKLRRICYTNSERKEQIKILTMFIAKEKSELDSLRSEEYMNDAINELERISRDEGIIGLYDAEEIERKVRNTQIKGAKLEGIEQGKKEVAKKMLAEKIDIELIMKITELTKEEIEKLK